MSYFVNNIRNNEVTCSSGVLFMKITVCVRVRAGGRRAGAAARAVAPAPLALPLPLPRARRRRRGRRARRGECTFYPFTTLVRNNFIDSSNSRMGILG